MISSLEGLIFIVSFSLGGGGGGNGILVVEGVVWLILNALRAFIFEITR